MVLILKKMPKSKTKVFKHKRLNEKNAIYTPRSTATVMVNYSEKDKTLEVEYKKSSEVVHYLKVPAKIWKKYQSSIISGESSGIFLNIWIKPYYKQKKLNL
jgi:hypothetical protein